MMCWSFMGNILYKAFTIVFPKCGPRRAYGKKKKRRKEWVDRVQPPVGNGNVVEKEIRQGVNLNYVECKCRQKVGN